MLTRTLAVTALAMLCAGAAQAGSLQAGAWVTKCANPGTAPVFDGKDPKAYNASAKVAAEYQQKAKDYADCVTADAKADQQLVVDGANGSVKVVADALTKLSADSQEALAKLQKGSKPAAASSAASPHDRK